MYMYTCPDSKRVGIHVEAMVTLLFQFIHARHTAKCLQDLTSTKDVLIGWYFFRRAHVSHNVYTEGLSQSPEAMGQIAALAPTSVCLAIESRPGKPPLLTKLSQGDFGHTPELHVELNLVCLSSKSQIPCTDFNPGKHLIKCL